MNLIGGTISSLPVGLENINYIKLENGIYDDFYATHINPDLKTPNNFEVPENWDKETYLHAKFNGNLFSGNADFGVENTTNVIIKRRKKGTFRWFPIYDQIVESANDFNFQIYDNYGAANVTYEYAAVPIVNGHEGTYTISECTPEFNCILIMDRDEMYSTLCDIEISQQKNNTSTTITPIQQKYPIYVANAKNDYYTGNISATFLNISCDNPNPTEREVFEFRSKVLDFLNNRKVKYIKDPWGRCWVAAIGTTISDEDNGNPFAHKISFDFTEVGDSESCKDMNNFEFLNVGEEWWT